MKLKQKEIIFESRLLQGNPLGDPAKRKIVTLEPEKPEGMPIIIMLSGYGGSSLAMLNYDSFAETPKDIIEHLVVSGKLKGSIFVFPDMFTRVGGNQYLDSTAVGMYESFLIKELVPYLRDKYTSRHIGVIGKSSGGYGAITLAMKHPDVINAAADHSGDAYFEYCYLPDFPKACNGIAKYGSAERWLDAYWKKKSKRLPEDMLVLNTVGMAAFYSPKGSAIELPFELDNCELIDAVWEKWLEKDPVRMVDKYYNNLKKLKFLMVDAGNKDEYNLNWGNKILHNRLTARKIRHTYEEFEGGHSNINYRYEVSLPLLEEALR